MHRIDGPGATVDNRFTDGDPVGGVQATVVTDDWANDVQEELMSVLAAAGIAPVKGTQDQVVKAFRALIALSVPSGMVAPFAASLTPSGWLKANGAPVSRTTYAALFAVIGTTFGVGDGATTFNLPDLRAEVIRGWDDGRGIDIARAFGSLQLDAFQGHWHAMYFTAATTVGAGGNTYVQHTTSGNIAGPITDAVRAPLSDGANGTPRIANETRSRNVALLYCIKI